MHGERRVDGLQSVHHLGSSQRGGLSVRQTEQLTQHLQERLERLGAELVLAIAPHHAAGQRRLAGQELLHQPRLAHPGSTQHRDTLQAANLGLPQALRQQVQHLATADERQQAAPAPRLLAAGLASPTEDAVSRHRLDPALDAHVAQRAGLEVAKLRTECLFADQNLVTAGSLAQPRSKIGHRTHQIETAPHGIAVVQQHQPGVDARVQRQRQARSAASVRRHRAHHPVQFQRRLRGAAGVVLAGTRVTEDRQRAIALDADHRTAVAGQHLGVGLAQISQDHRIPLRLHRTTQACRVAQIGKHDRQVPAMLAPGRRQSGCGLVSHVVPTCALPRFL